MPQVLRHEELQVNENLPMGNAFSSNVALDTPAAGSELPKLKDFPKALMRLLRNKLLIFNIVSAIFYILGAAGFMTFLTRYMEVQFHKNAQDATIITGPLSIIGMVLGLLGSGIIISKKKPRPSYVLMWNVIVGCVYMAGQISYMFMYCGDSASMLTNGKLNLTTSCNSHCGCDFVPYSPVCDEDSEMTFFSPCHAGCYAWNSDDKFYSNCTCLAPTLQTTIPPNPLTGGGVELRKSFLTSTQSIETSTTMPPLISSTASSSIEMTSMFIDESTTNNAGLLSRTRRALEDVTSTLKPGVCLKGCNAAFLSFAIASMIINWLGSSGRIGNILVNYRAVATEDKSFAQGLCLMLISLFALIPGPILFGRIIDSTCLVWTKTCSGNGNCQLYDQTRFRYLVNSCAFSLTALGAIFDVLVWYYGRNLDLYGEKEIQRLEQVQRKNMPITPLLAKST